MGHVIWTTEMDNSLNRYGVEFVNLTNIEELISALDQVQALLILHETPPDITGYQMNKLFIYSWGFESNLTKAFKWLRIILHSPLTKALEAQLVLFILHIMH